MKHHTIIGASILSLMLGIVSFQPQALAQKQIITDNHINTNANPWLLLNNAIADNSKIGPWGIPDTVSVVNVSGHRDIKTYIYFPKNKPETDMNVIIVSSRFGQSVTATFNLLRRLASQGFVVVAPEHEEVNNYTAKIQNDSKSLQSRVNDVHDMVRFIPTLKSLTKMAISDRYSFLCFKEGALDCLMNSGTASDLPEVKAWPGNPASILLVSPGKDDVDRGYASLNKPIMVAGKIEDMGIRDGILAQMPDNSIRVLAALKSFDDPLMSGTDTENPNFYYWSSLITTWFKANMNNDTKSMDALKDQSFDRYSGNFIRTNNVQ